MAGYDDILTGKIEAIEDQKRQAASAAQQANEARDQKTKASMNALREFVIDELKAMQKANADRGIPTTITEIEPGNGDASITLRFGEMQLQGGGLNLDLVAIRVSASGKSFVIEVSGGVKGRGVGQSTASIQEIESALSKAFGLAVDRHLAANGLPR